MIYSKKYPKAFGKTARDRHREKLAKEKELKAKEPQAVIVKEVPKVVAKDSVPVAEESKEAEQVSDEAQLLADQYTVAELKDLASDYGIEVPSRIKELELATMIAKKKLSQP